MFEQFKESILSGNFLNVPENILLGISGGIDSMVMISLFLRAGYPVSAAHCNFRLRGRESDLDMSFVSDYCLKNDVPLHTKVFDTADYAAGNGISLQMAARELRYSWFEQLRSVENYSYIAIAHNKNDLAETILINLVRGTGIRGLTGIRMKNGYIIRPLLFAERKEILEYASRHNIQFREDASNTEIKYRRNRIRHRIIPEFEAISPAFVNTLFTMAGRLKDVEAIYNQTIAKKFDEICIKTDHGFKLSIEALTTLDPLPPYLYEFMKKWDFPRDAIPDIAASLHSPSGKQFFSPTHRLIKDRHYLLISPLPGETGGRYYIEENETAISHPISLRLTRTKNHPDFVIPGNPGIACLDLDLLHFPLILRKWQKGDYFQPLGMEGLKKLSDFFVDNKFSLLEKERTWIIASGNKVAWIAGHRIDNRFRITGRTRNILMIEIPGEN